LPIGIKTLYHATVRYCWVGTGTALSGTISEEYFSIWKDDSIAHQLWSFGKTVILFLFWCDVQWVDGIAIPSSALGTGMSPKEPSHIRTVVYNLGKIKVREPMSLRKGRFEAA
jgi:hypothetical protein